MLFFTEASSKSGLSIYLVRCRRLQDLSSSRYHEVTRKRSQECLYCVCADHLLILLLPLLLLVVFIKWTLLLVWINSRIKIRIKTRLWKWKPFFCAMPQLPVIYVWRKLINLNKFVGRYKSQQFWGTIACLQQNVLVSAIPTCISHCVSIIHTCLYRPLCQHQPYLPV